ncbi:hypothetical protein NPIL_154521 [Nephila pilipes]|uniref:Uncharacterized protein n=1 Tax=Nephila pilipes TaxID=299642 RepID=A0A8X6I2W0_NEPPI|nr:hypothetical protein NPIL_154521 [Nephila pilipes]
MFLPHRTRNRKEWPVGKAFLKIPREDWGGLPSTAHASCKTQQIRGGPNQLHSPGSQSKRFTGQFVVSPVRFHTAWPAEADIKQSRTNFSRREKPKGKIIKWTSWDLYSKKATNHWGEESRCSAQSKLKTSGTEKGQRHQTNHFSVPSQSIDRINRLAFSLLQFGGTSVDHFQSTRSDSAVSKEL